MKIRELDPEETQALQEGLVLASRLLDQPLPLSIDAAQELYDALLETDGTFEHGIIALGLAFGQCIADSAGYEWVRVTDEFGDETCLRLPGIEITCAPISMIQKRLAARLPVNLSRLLYEVIEQMATMERSGEYRSS